MYNGVGLLTARGSGTSGHVQTNKFNLRRAPPPKFNTDKPKAPTQQGPNQDILLHNRKREIELKLLELRDELEEKG